MRGGSEVFLRFRPKGRKKETREGKESVIKQTTGQDRTGMPTLPNMFSPSSQISLFYFPTDPPRFGIPNSRPPVLSPLLPLHPTSSTPSGKLPRVQHLWRSDSWHTSVGCATAVTQIQVLSPIHFNVGEMRDPFHFHFVCL